MIICYFSNANNYHTQKWAAYFASMGNVVHVLSLEEPKIECNEPAIHYHWLKNASNRSDSDIRKLGYLTTLRLSKRLLREIKPDIVHAHYASSYGAICALSSKLPFFLSVWGKDVYDFPKKSVFHKSLLKYVLSRSSWILSTSSAMAKETEQYTDQRIYITPFGVDMDTFQPRPELRNPQMFTVGTIKALDSKYGIDVLLKACARVKQARPDLPLSIRIAGKGPEAKKLAELAGALGLGNSVQWLGFISQKRAAEEWASFDVAIIPSVEESESFGVSAVEAQACRTPLIISDIPGLLEASNQGETAIVVPRGDEEALCQAILRLADTPKCRAEMGKNGRAYVESHYELNSCFARVSSLYEEAVQTCRQ